MIPLIVIEGATAAGKSSLALQLAKRLNTEIISADSRQVYKYLNIGTAKPSKEELLSVKHHLVSIIKPDLCFNAGLFVEKSSTLIKKLNKLGKIPIVCGGTGLYVKALLEGLFIENARDTAIRSDLEKILMEHGLEALYRELCRVDAVAAKKIDTNDKQRILRALEVYWVTGTPISEHWNKQSRKQVYNPYRILMDEAKPDLYSRIDTRIQAMVNAGLIDEILRILKAGYSWGNPGFNSVGYKEFQPYIENIADLEQCVKLAAQHTRNYAKRQVTWYRKCNFNLSATASSINIDSIEEKIYSYFDRNTNED
jgi:tRNA dimethylallyltransferase